jgi:hypothetical protein
MKIITKISAVAIFCVHVFSVFGMRVDYAQPSHTLASYLDYSRQLFLQANPQIDMQSLAMHARGGLLMQYDKVTKAGVATFRLPDEKELPSLTAQEAEKIRKYFKVYEIKMIEGHCVILFNYTDEKLLPQNKLQAALLLLRPTLNDIPFAAESSHHSFLSELQQTAIFTANQTKPSEASFASESQHTNECAADLSKEGLLHALKISSHSAFTAQKQNTGVDQVISSIDKTLELPQMAVSGQKEGVAGGLKVFIDQIWELKDQGGFASRAVAQADSDCKRFQDIQLNDQAASEINKNIPAPLAFYMQQRDQCKIDLSKGSLIYIYKIKSGDPHKAEKQFSVSDQKIDIINRNLSILNTLGSSQKRAISEALNHQIDELWEIKVNEGFAIGTLVKTDSSYQKIEDIKPGQTVIAYDAQKQELTSRKVLNTFTKHVSSYVLITLNGTTIKTAVDQKLHIPSKNLYVTAKELSKSAELQAAYPIAISDIELVDAEADICMLTVEQDHNFFVSEQDVLAHNIAPLFVLVPLAAPAAVGIAATIIIPAVKFAGFAVGGWVAAKFFESFTYHPTTDRAVPQNQNKKNINQDSKSKPQVSGGGGGGPWKPNGNGNGHGAPYFNPNDNENNKKTDTEKKNENNNQKPKNQNDLNHKEVAKHIAENASEIAKKLEEPLNNLIKNGNIIKQIDQKAFKIKHIFSAKHIKHGLMRLGENTVSISKNAEIISNKVIEIIKNADTLMVLKEGHNKLQTQIDGLSVEIRLFIENNNLRSVDAFINYAKTKNPNVIKI